MFYNSFTTHQPLPCPSIATLWRVQRTIAAVLALTPLLILPFCFFYYDVTPKIAVALIGTAIALLLLLRDSALNEVRRLWSDPLGCCFCLLTAAQLIWLLLSTVFSSDPALSWNGGNWRRFGFVSQCAVAVLAFLIASSCSPSRLRILLRAITVAGAAVALYGILQYFGVDPILPSASYHVGDGVLAIVRPPSTLGQADYFAGYLIYVVFLGAALAVTESRPVWKALAAVAAVGGSAAVVFSGTRGALLGLATGAVSLWIWKRPRFTRRHAILTAGLCAGGLMFYFAPAGLQLRARTQWAMEDLRGGARIWLWRDALRMAEKRWLIGFGTDTFGREFPRYQSVALSRAFPDFYHESPHNIFLDALVSEGIPGLAILAGFAVLGFVAAGRANVSQQRAAPFLTAALVAGLISNLFVCFTLPGALYFYATIAMLVSLATLPRNLVTESAPKALRVPAFALSLTAVAMFLYFTVRITASDVVLLRAKGDLEAGRIQDSIAAYTSSQRWHVAGSNDDLFFSRALALRASQPAFLIARRAPEASEEPQNAWFNLAGFYANQNDAVDVEACLRRSVEASPTWFKSHWALAQLLMLIGRRPEALAEAMRAADLDGGKDPEVANFLQTVHHRSSPPDAE